jgi:hypothetical protein
MSAGSGTLSRSVHTRIAIQNRNKINKRVGRESLQTAGHALALQLPRHQRQIDSAQVNQYALENIFSSAQVHAAHPAHFIGTPEAAFQ